MGLTSSSPTTALIKDVIDANSNELNIPTRGLKMSESEVRTLWDTYDVDHSGTLDIGEADKFILDLLNGLEQKEVEVAKLLYDDDKSALKQEMNDVKNMYSKLKTNRKRFIQALDANGDGVVQYDEFTQFLDNFRVSNMKKSVQ